MGLFDRLFSGHSEEKEERSQPSEEVFETVEDNQETVEEVREDVLTEDEQGSVQAVEGPSEEAMEQTESESSESQEDILSEEVTPETRAIVENGAEVQEEEASQKEEPAEPTPLEAYYADLQRRIAEASRETAEKMAAEAAREQERHAAEAQEAWDSPEASPVEASDRSASADVTDGRAEESQDQASIETPGSTAPESEQAKYDRSLKKTRSGFGARLNAFFANFRTVDEEFFEELEELLILSDVGVQVASQLTEELRQEARLENAKKPEQLRQVVIEKLVDLYEKDGVYNEAVAYQPGLTVMLFVGVNGVGKTTSIGKLAYKLKNEGKKVMLVAADTFRAGAVAQLEEWARRVGVSIVTGPEKSDPASVVFDGMERAVAEGVDVLMIDTAGRLQNKDNLMAELEKIGRIIKRVVPDAPHETFLALDASTGQNALVQAKEFSKITPVTGIVLTKIDGTARGGVVLAIREELDIPVKLIGFGEKIDDIGEFNSENFMRGLLEGLI